MGHPDSSLHETVSAEIYEDNSVAQMLGLSDVRLVVGVMICEWYQSNGVGRVLLSSMDCP
jgi:hypothetical protein